MPGRISRMKCSEPPYKGGQNHKGRSALVQAKNVVVIAAMPLAKNAASSDSSQADNRCSAALSVGLLRRL